MRASRIVCETTPVLSPRFGFALRLSLFELAFPPMLYEDSKRQALPVPRHVLVLPPYVATSTPVPHLWGLLYHGDNTQQDLHMP